MRPILLSAVLFVVAVPAWAAESLPEQVDRLIAAKAGAQTLASAADDAEFLRRVSLDFAGDLPSGAEARAFFADTAGDKRAKLVKKLIAAPRFSERLADAFHVMLMERRGENADWRAYLVEAFKENKPWDVMAREILSPDFLDAKQRGAGYFATQRLDKVGQQTTDYPGLTRDAGRMFMGVDLQCAQCHNHLTVKGYKQADFNGLFVAFQNAKLEKAAGEYKTAWLSEGALTAKYDFVSVLTQVKGQTGPRVPFSEEVAIPDLKGDDVWLVKPDRKKAVIGQPKFSPMKEVAKGVATKDNPWFVRNIANRVWWIMMGRGLVEPLDLQHSGNPASHPELLDLLAEQLVAHNFDLKWLIHELALTQTYQRSSQMPAGAKPPAEELFAVAKERPLSAEQLGRAFLRATGEWDRVSENKKAEASDDAKKYALADFQGAFRMAFANAPKEPELTVNPTLKSALFLRNSEQVLWALKARPDNLVARLAATTDNAQVAEELYLSILTRLPSAEEKAEVAAWLEKRSADRPRAVGDYAWALLSSAEFFCNH
jgi:hypothetical protein